MSGTKVDGTSTLVRPKFGPGMLLQSDDLDQLAVYTRDLSRLMFRSLFGCGVICGLVVKPDNTKCGAGHITVGAGVALDCSGDPIYVPKDQTLPIDDTCDPQAKTAWVILCGKSKNCAPRTAMCANDQDETTSICTRERDGFEIRVTTTPPSCACNCSNCPPQDDQKVPKKPKAGPEPVTSTSDCWCADPNLPCLKDHYLGHCSSCACCGDCSGGCSDADCVILARLDWTDKAQWTADHSVRRFIRPVLMRDPQVAAEAGLAAKAKAEKDVQDQLAKELAGFEGAAGGAAPAPAAPPAPGAAGAHPLAPRKVAEEEATERPPRRRRTQSR